MNKNPLIKGTIILTLAGFISKFCGFALRIFLSRFLGAEGLGIYQLIFPVYMLGIVVSSYGIQTAISRFVAAAPGECPKEQSAYLKAGTLLSLCPSLFLAFGIYYFAPEISLFLLNEKRCIPLLQVGAFCIPLEAVHICINGFYYGQKKTAVPAFSQFMEQTMRIAGVLFLFTVTEKNNLTFTPVYAIAGNLIGDIASILFGFSALSFTLHTKKVSQKTVTPYPVICRKILGVAFPLTCNQTVVHIFHSVETILIPTMLQNFGYSNSAALSIYGVLTGMALPLIMFPSTITNAFAVLLLPAISEAEALGNRKQVLSVSRGAVSICTILGIFSTGFFLVLGQDAGMILYDNEQVGGCLRILGFLCPFLFLNVTLSSILNGLGKAAVVFRNNMIALGIRILFILFAIPNLGIKGYFLGFLVSSIITTFLLFCALRFLKTPLLDSTDFLAKPALAFGCAYFILKLLCYFDALKSTGDFLPFLIKTCLLFVLYLAFLKLFIPKLSIRLLTNPDKSRIVKQKIQ